MAILLAAAMGIDIATPLLGESKLQVRDGRPVVEGVYINGHGPYRFLIDTGTNVNLIETGIAGKIGMNATFQVDLASAAGKIPSEGSDGNEIVLGSVKAAGQRFLILRADAMHGSSLDVQGVLGQWFLSRFDYTIDLRGKRLEFGKQDRSGTRTPFEMINARPVISTSLGALALDSGTNRVVLFRVRPDSGPGRMGELQTFAGSQRSGLVAGKALIIEGRKIWIGDAVAMPSRTEPGVDGLMPLSLFKTVYVCNSEGYAIFD
jgi:Aspartyl protease